MFHLFFWMLKFIVILTVYIFKGIIIIVVGLFSIILKPKFDPCADYDSMNGSDFEEYCASLLRKNGYSMVTTTKASGDDGCDIVAYKNGYKYVVQCKCYSNNVGNSAVQQVISARIMYKAQRAAVITNRFFTASAKRTAIAGNVILWDRNDLNQMANAAIVKSKVYNSNNAKTTFAIPNIANLVHHPVGILVFVLIALLFAYIGQAPTSAQIGVDSSITQSAIQEPITTNNSNTEPKSIIENSTLSSTAEYGRYVAYPSTINAFMESYNNIASIKIDGMDQPVANNIFKTEFSNEGIRIVLFDAKISPNNDSNYLSVSVYLINGSKKELKKVNTIIKDSLKVLDTSLTDEDIDTAITSLSENKYEYEDLNIGRIHTNYSVHNIEKIYVSCTMKIYR